MKRLLGYGGGGILLILLLIGILFWSGVVMSPAGRSGPPPQVSRFDTRVMCDERSGGQVTLYGEGFTGATRVSLVKGVAQTSAVQARLPLEGFFSTALLYSQFLYLGSNDRGLKALDLKRPLEPLLVGEYLQNRTVTDIQRQGSWLYLSCGRQGLVVMRIMPDGRLSLVSEWMTPRPVTGSVVLGNLLFAISAGQELLVYDVGRPEAVQPLDPLVLDGQIVDIASDGDYLYVVTKTAKLEILQRTATGAKWLYQMLPLPGRPSDVLLQNGMLSIAVGPEVVQYRLEQPGKPVPLRRISGFDVARRLFPGEDVVYVSDGFSQLQSFALDSGERRQTLVLNQHVRTLVEYRQRLYLAGARTGLLMVRRSGPDPLKNFNHLALPGSAHDLVVQDGQLYVAAMRKGTLRMKLDEKGASYEQISSHRSEALALSGQRLYIAQGKHGLEVFDLSQPDQPRAIARWTERKAYEIAAGRRYLALGQGASGVELIELQSQGGYRIADQLTDIHPISLQLREDLLFVATKAHGIHIYRIGRNGRLKETAHLATPFPMNHFTLPLDLALYRDVLYIADGASGVMVADISDLEDPQIIGAVNLPGISKSLSVEADRLVVAGQEGGVTTLDITHPESPEVIGRQALAEVSRGLVVSGGKIYVARYELGVSVLPIPMLLQDIAIESSQHMNVRVPRPPERGRYDLWLRNRGGIKIVTGAVNCQETKN